MKAGRRDGGARRTEALTTVHRLSVAAVLLAGLGLLAARAAESSAAPVSAVEWSSFQSGS